MVETVRIATNGQPRPPRRYGLTPLGAYQTGLAIPPINRRAEQLLAAPHLEVVRQQILCSEPVRRRLVWAISPWRASLDLALDALACLRRSGDAPVLVAFAEPPPGASPSWWYVELRRSWNRFRNSRGVPDIGLAVIGAPFALSGFPTLAASRWKHMSGPRPAPVYFLSGPGSGPAINLPESWQRLPSLGILGCCPWDDPCLASSNATPESFLDGKIPGSPRRQPLAEWAGSSTHPAAFALRPTMRLTHGQASLLQALLRYPAFTPDELAALTGFRPRTVVRGLRQLNGLALAEHLPLFQKEQRYALTSAAIDILAYQSMQTPSRFRSRQSWPTEHEPFTAFPNHMKYILAFMFALQKQGRLLEWDLVHARYGYTVAAAPADLARPRRVALVPDSSGVLSTEKGPMPFWLEIDRGTRTGQRLVRQLEKYVLARFGDGASAPIPLLLYVVAEGGEARARLVARRLVELTARYRLTRTPSILITTWELLTGRERSGQPQPLRAVWRLPFRWRQFVAPQLPMGKVAECADGLEKVGMDTVADARSTAVDR